MLHKWQSLQPLPDQEEGIMGHHGAGATRVLGIQSLLTHTNLHVSKPQTDRPHPLDLSGDDEVPLHLDLNALGLTSVNVLPLQPNLVVWWQPSLDPRSQDHT